MVIDIDSFLEDYKQDNGKNPQNQKKVNLDFQKEVEEKLDSVAKGANNEDFKTLFKIYEELKKFDEDLPQKLLGIKKSSGTALKTVGTKYSDEFLKGVRSSMQNLTQSIRNRLVEIDKQISDNNISNAITNYNEASKEYKIFPKEFTLEKIEIGQELRKREIEINQKLEVMKDEEVKKVREILRKEINDLKLGINNKDVEVVEKQIDTINYIMDKTPKIFFAHLINERIGVAKTIMVAETFLGEEYKKSFEEKKEIIYHLFDNFHKYYVDKNVNNALSTYDEILFAFENVPDVFIEEKIEIYKQISTIFESINNLLMTSNINLFLESYNDSKVIIEARNYLEHMTKTKRYDPKIIQNLSDKLSKVSNKLRPQTIEIVKDMKDAIKLCQSNSNEFKPQEKTSISEITPPITSQVDLKKPLIEDEKTGISDDVSKNIMSEINSYWEKMKGSSDKKEIITLYKKINFYLDMLHISDFEKKKILNKINEFVKTKVK